MDFQFAMHLFHPTPRNATRIAMLSVVERADAFLVDTASGFCRTLQTRLGLPYPLALTIVSYAAAGIAIAGTIAMFGLSRAEGKIIVVGWCGALFMMTAFVLKAFMPSIRRWDALAFMRAYHFAARMQVSTRPIRITSAVGTMLMALMAFTHSDIATAINSLRYTFVTMVPICLMIYSYSTLPVATPRIIDDLRRLRSSKES